MYPLLYKIDVFLSIIIYKIIDKIEFYMSHHISNENGCIIPEYVMTMVIGMESTEALRMLVDIGKMPLDKADYTLYAAQKGNLEHLQYLHEKNTPWHVQAVNMAARNKHLIVLILVFLSAHHITRISSFWLKGPLTLRTISGLDYI